MKSQVHLYVLAVVIGAIAAGFSVYWMDPLLPSEYVTAAIAFAGLGLLANQLSHGLARGASGSIAFIPFITAALLAPHWITVLTVAVSVAAIETLRRRVPIKGLFNVAQHSLSIGAAVAVYLALGGRSLLGVENFSALPYAALFITFLLVNSLAVSGAIAVSDNHNMWQVWRQNTLKSAGYDLLSLPIAYFFAWFYREHAIIGAISLAVPMIGFRQVYKAHWQLERNHEELLQLMVAAIEARDPYTSGHSKRVSRNAKLIARIVGLSSRQIDQIGVAALLHDVGKIHEIFAPILRKPDRLTPEEWAIMQTHPIKSAELVAHVSQLKHAVPALRHHHENWDGSGYPDGLAGHQIPLGARIIIFADTIDAMMSDRPYRKAMTEGEVRDEIARMRGRQFDPEICDKLLRSPQLGLLFSTPGQTQPLDTVGMPPARPALLTPQYVHAISKNRRAV